jgi:tetratricopeptide (TPR) repeat protein
VTGYPATLRAGDQGRAEVEGRAAVGGRDGRLQRAEQLREQHVRDPDGVLTEARALVAEARRDVELRVVARHALCLAHSERHELGAALRQARLALGAATKAGLAQRAAEVRLTMAWLELDRGRADASVAHLDLAQPLLRGRSAARARCLRGLNLCASGQLIEAIAELTTALPGLRRHDDKRWVANALVGRGIANSYIDALRAADADFAAAVDLLRSLGEHERAAAVIHNRGFVAVRSGDVPRGLQLFEQAVADGLDLGKRTEGLIDQAEAMLAAGLTDDARPVLEQASELLAAAGRRAKLAEATLVTAQCALRQRDLAGAQSLAAQAARLFRAQGRSWWLPLASAVHVRARWLAGERSASLQRAAQRTAAACASHGWKVAAASCSILAAQVAMHRGAVRQAASLLDETAARRSRGTADVRAAAWYAEALLRRASGDRRGVLSACRAGLRVVDEHAASLGAVELQALANRLSGELAELAVGVALGEGEPRAVLRWTERYRAGVLARPAVRPPADPALAADLVALRSAAATARAAVRSGRPDLAVERRVARLEQQVRRRSLAASSGVAGRRSPLDLAELPGALGDAALVSFIVHSGQLCAVSVVDGRVRLHSLGSVEPLHAELDSLRFTLHRLARGTSGQVTAALRAACSASASTLDSALIAPLLGAVGDRPLVLVPTGPLHALPWAALPSLTGRPVVVAPSVLSWLRAVRSAAAHRGSGTAWVAGPGLQHAEPEVRALHAADGGRLLTGRSSTVDAVLSAMDCCAVTHIAAHGRFRSDQPLFSALELADGELYVHDLDRLRNGPRLLVLSACEAGLSAVRPGDELMGLAAALLCCGTATLVASVVPVPDEPTSAVMAALHAGLRSGLTPAAALAAAQAQHGQLGFVCFGAP